MKLTGINIITRMLYSLQVFKTLQECTFYIQVFISLQQSLVYRYYCNYKNIRLQVLKPKEMLNHYFSDIVAVCWLLQACMCH